jgi:DNA repair exonuclease SbcCD ATPase subunit
MLFFRKLRYKNILSTGNTFTEIDLDGSPTTLIIGQNGSGKSTFLDALSYVLFGKPFRKINRPQLLNSINQKNLMVEVEFQIGTKEYLIKRGMKPNVFEIWQDGTLLNQDAAARDYQDVLEKTILKLNHKSFCQIIILGSSTFVPFMQLPTGQRREIIEDLLDIQIFSRMNILLKDRISQNKNDIQEVKYQIDLIKEKITLHRNLIKKLQKNNDQQIDDLQNKIFAAQEKINDYEALIQEKMTEEIALRDSISDQESNNKKRETAASLIKSLREKIKKLNAEIAFYHDNDNCPTCKQGIEHTFKDETIEGKRKSLRETEEGLETLEAQFVNIDKRSVEIGAIMLDIAAIQRKTSEYNGHISSGYTHIKDTTKELEELKVKNVEDTNETNVIESLKKEYIEKEKFREELFKDKGVLDVAAVLLKDGGIKAKIIKQYVPVINKLINKYLAIMELPISFELDENFNETIKSRFRDTFSYESFSEGEKKRVDLSILFAWRAIAKMRNSANSNLLVLDEIMDGAMDGTGMEQLDTIIRTICADTNVFIISHRENLMDKFSNVIKFEKHKDFSRISN